jgi:hypothetical protein
MKNLLWDVRMMHVNLLHTHPGDGLELIEMELFSHFQKLSLMLVVRKKREQQLDDKKVFFLVHNGKFIFISD